MYTIYLALGVAFTVAFLPLVFGVAAAWTVLPGVFAGIITFVWVNRRVAKRVEAVTQAADAEMAQLQQIAQSRSPNAQAAMMQRFEKSIEILKRGFLFQKWQVGVTTMLNARIGMLIFTRWMLSGQLPQMKGKFSLKEAIPFLARSRVKGQKAKLLQALWPAWAMLAVSHYKGEKSTPRAIAVLEDSVKAASKQGLLWSLYAWILWTEKQSGEAMDVLVRGKEAAPDDKVLAENLIALQNGKKLNMRGYGEQWYQFGLERPKMAAQQAQIGHPRMRGGARRR